MFLEVRFHYSYFDLSSNSAVKTHIKRWIGKQKFKMTKYLYGFETKNKFGEDTQPHIHFKFEIDEDAKKNTLQKSFKTYMSNLGIELKGVKHYAIILTAQPEDEDRWWRYVLKEEGAITGGNMDPEWVSLNKALAIDERKLQIKRNCEARARFLENDSFKGKMYLHLKDELKIETEREFYIAMIDYYKSKSKTAPFSKIRDYWPDYKICVGLMTSSEYVDAFIMKK